MKTRKPTMEEMEAAYRRQWLRTGEALEGRGMARVWPRARRFGFGDVLRPVAAVAAAVALLLALPPADGRAMSPGADRADCLATINAMLAAV